MKITNNHHTIISEQRKKILKTLLLSVVAICAFFAVKNAIRGTYLIAIIEVFITLASVVLHAYVQKIDDNKVFFRISVGFLILIYTLIIPSVLHPSASVTSFLWFFIIPSSAYAILGKKMGFILSFIFGITCIVSYQFTIHVSEFSSYNMATSFLLIWYISHIYESGNLESIHKLELLSSTDPLTKLYNRAVLTEIHQNHHQGTLSTYIVIDIDFFKKINDNYGHDTGDAALVFFAEHLKKYFDDMGYVLRMGGEEFCVVLPNLSIVEAEKLCTKCMRDLASINFMYQNNAINFTFSAGLSSYPIDGESSSKLLKVADSRLYYAKENGRNRVVSQ